MAVRRVRACECECECGDARAPLPCLAPRWSEGDVSGLCGGGDGKTGGGSLNGVAVESEQGKTTGKKKKEKENHPEREGKNSLRSTSGLEEKVSVVCFRKE